jgi:hypothetical protein
VDELKAAISASESSGLTDRLNSLVVLPFCGSSGLDRILAYLRERFGDNFHEKQIAIRGNEVPGSERKLCYAADFKVLQYPHDYFSENTPNSWLLYDFKDMRIIPTQYKIRSYCQPAGILI